MRTAFLLLMCSATIAFSGCVTSTEEAPHHSSRDTASWVNEHTLNDERNKLRSELGDLLTDLQLSNLVEQALSENFDLQAAALRVESLRYEFRAHSRARLPLLQAQVHRSEEKFENLFSESIEKENLRRASLSLEWELDFWGRLAATARSKQADYFAASWELEAARRALAAEVMRLWASLAAQNAQLKLEQHKESIVSKIELIATEDYEQGLIDHLSFISLRSLWLDTQLGISAIEENIQLTQITLATLLGRQNVSSYSPDNALPLLPEFNFKAPAWVLAHRPDVQAAWETYLSASHMERASHRALLPQFVIDGSVFRTGESWGSLNAAETLWQIVGGARFIPAHIPFLAGSAYKAQLEASRLQRDAQWMLYEGVVLNALQEVEGLFVQDRQLGRRVQVAQDTLVFQRAQYQEELFRYESGLAGLMAVFQAELTLLDRRTSVLELKAQHLETRINLAQALGLPLYSQPEAREEEISGV